MTKTLKIFKCTKEQLSTFNRFLMDYAFVTGPEANKKTGNIISSFDGYTSYLMIVDEASRYIWVLLAKDKPPNIYSRQLLRATPPWAPW